MAKPRDDRQKDLLRPALETIIDHAHPLVRSCDSPRTLLGMTPFELIDFRTRMGWSQAELARQLGISPSRIVDYELGSTRGKARRPAPIPRVVELAVGYLGGGQAPLSTEERAV
jgi:DNA-binding XRE family transcriptional regulator